MARGDSASASAHRIHSFIPHPLLLPSPLLDSCACPRNNKKPPAGASCRLQHTQGNGGRQPGRQIPPLLSISLPDSDDASVRSASQIANPLQPLRYPVRYVCPSLSPHPTLDPSIQSIVTHAIQWCLLLTSASTSNLVWFFHRINSSIYPEIAQLYVQINVPDLFRFSSSPASS